MTVGGRVKERVNEGREMSAAVWSSLSLVAVCLLLLLVSMPSWTVVTAITTDRGDELSLSDITQVTCFRQEIAEMTAEEHAKVAGIDMLMTVHERVLLWRYLQQASLYVEYGAGGSTQLACLSKVKHYLTIEADAAFLLQLIRNSDCLIDAMLQARFFAEYINIGPVSAFSVPIDSTWNHAWINYPNAIINIANKTKLSVDSKPDLVLVDGRFRVASALTALTVMDDDGILLIHDFFNRPHYYIVLEFANVVDCVATLLVAKKKKDMNMTRLQELITEYQYQYN